MPALLSIVVPVFNEAGSLEPLYEEIAAALAERGAFEVVFVDDGSTDGSFAAMERLAAEHDGVRIVRLRRNFGKAAALTHGFAESRGELVVTMDGDRQDDPAEILKLLAKLDEGYDLVSGWKQSRKDPFSKTVPSKLFNWTVRTSTGVSLHDFNCGLKAYRRPVTEHVKVYGELHRYIPVLASDLGFRVAEVKVGHRRRTSGRSKYGWRRYGRGYLDLLTVLFLGRYRQRPQHLFGGIGTFMVVVGVLIDLYLTIDKLRGHAIGQRPLLLLGTLLIIVGIQLVSLGLVGELITQARAREKRDDYEVDRVIEGAPPRAALGAARAAAVPDPDGARSASDPERAPAAGRPAGS
jgi:glycosyltransferase involved in cell wall biosynthesis